MINSISDTLRLAGQLAPIVQPLKSSTVEQTATKVPTLPSALGAYRFSAFSRWAKACEIQHRISSEQIVLQTLKRFEKVLIALQNGLKQQQTAEQLEPLRQLLINHQASYLGIPLFDQQLNRYRFGMTQVKFQLQGVQLLAQHQHSEQLQLNLPFAGRTVAVGLFFDANSHESQQLTMINQQLSMYDIHCHRGTDAILSSYYFSCPHEVWLKLKDGIMMQGQGFRLPAGLAVNVQVTEMLDWQNPRQWQFDSVSERHQSYAKITKTLHKVQQKWLQCQQGQQQLLVLLQQQNAYRPRSEIELLADSIQPIPSVIRQAAILAQANVARLQTEQLLNNKG